MNPITAIALSLLAVSLLIYLVQFLCVFHHTRRRPASSMVFAEPISIIKPLCGYIEGLEENLESFARMDYPLYEIILGVKSSDDSALPVARAFQERHPSLPIKIVINNRQYGYNPKVNNLVPMMTQALHDMVLISDDNVRVEKNYLRDTIAEMSDGVGLVYNLIRGTGAAKLGAVLENLHLNSFIAGSVCFLHKVMSHPCVIGKSMLFRRSTLQRIGGFDVVRNVLAEDYLLGRYFQRRGYRVALCSRGISNVNVNWSLRRFVSRHARWAKMRFWIGTYQYASEWLGNPVTCAVIAFATQPSLLFGASLALISAGKIILDRMIARRLGADMPLQHFLLTPIKDLLIALIWFAPFMNRTIRWREKNYVVGLGSRLRPYEEKQFEEPTAIEPLPVLS